VSRPSLPDGGVAAPLPRAPCPVPPVSPRGPDPVALRAELKRRAAGIEPKWTYWIEGFEPPYGEGKNFCEPCAIAAAGDLDVSRELNPDAHTLRFCEGCAAMLDGRIGPEEAQGEVEHFETRPPTTREHWAELLQALAEVPPEDFRRPTDPPVEPSLLWARVAAILARSTCQVPREIRPCDHPPPPAEPPRLRPSPPRPRKTSVRGRDYLLHIRDGARTLCGRMAAKVNCFAQTPAEITEEACRACAQKLAGGAS
jgi:hypothetical protein